MSKLLTNEPSFVLKPVLSDLRGYVGLAAYGFRHMGLLRREPFTRRFLQVFLDTGKQGIGDIGVRSAGLGTLIIAYMVSMVSANPAAAVNILVIVVMREVGPLFAALIVLIRVGTVTAARLGLMNVRGETRHLQLLGVVPRDYLVVPALFAVALATTVLTFYFQLIAVGGGVLLSSLLMGLPLRELLEHLAMLLTPIDVAYTAIKSFFFGLIIATVTAYYGSGLSAETPGALPELLSKSIMQSLFVMMLFNAVFGYLVYGVLLFGIVRAQH